MRKRIGCEWLIVGTGVLLWASSAQACAGDNSSSSKTGQETVESETAPPIPQFARAVTLQESDGEAIVYSLSRLFDNVHIVWHNQTNMVLVRGPQDDIEQCVELVKQLDVKQIPEATMPQEETVVELIPLTHAASEEVADVVHKLFKSSSRRPPAGSLRVVTDQRLNTLILSGSPARVEKAKAIIVALDKPSGPRGQ